MSEKHGWEVLSAEWLYLDCLWRVVVEKRKQLKTVYFPQRVSVGQIVDLYRV